MLLPSTYITFLLEYVQVLSKEKKKEDGREENTIDLII